MTDEILCQWGGCNSHASSQVFTDDLKENLLLCGLHRKAALINLELYGKLKVEGISQAKTGKPNTNPMKGLGGKKPQTNPVAWEQEAAKKADSAAVEDVKPDNSVKKIIHTIGDFPKPRKM